MAKKEITLSFEEALDELETLVQTMEEERLPLEELISNYERGAQLHLHCESFLNTAKSRLEKIAQTKAAPVTKPITKPAQSSSNDDDEIRLF